MAKEKQVKKALGVLSGTGSRQKTQAQSIPDNSDVDGVKITPVGVGIMTGEKFALKAIAEEHGLTLNALMRFALRRFIVKVRAGEIDLNQEFDVPEPQKKKLRLPS